MKKEICCHCGVRMKQKSSKLAKLERNRTSILTDDLEHCFICKRQASEIHEIYSAGSRKQSMIYNFTIPICRECHQHITLNYSDNLKLKQICQQKFEESHTRKEFMKIIHRNYLE